MGKKHFFKRLAILPIIGLLFASLLSFTPVSALPSEQSQNTSENTNSETSQDNASVFNDDARAQLENRNNDVSNSDSSSDANSSENSESSEDDEPNCYDVVGAVGWLVCPVTTVVSSAVDSLYGIIQNFLAIEPITFNEDSSIYIIWATSRDVANLVFIILFLVVIYSQITGVGFDNYNIKKTLPRIIISAILVNLSFIICALAVDVSNLTGASVTGFFDSITSSIQLNGAEQTGTLSWAAVIGQMLGTAGLAAGGVAVAGAAIALSGGLAHFIWLIIPVVLGAIISLAIGLFTIALRQAVVSLLVMIAPLAFVAYLLPNTEPYFKKWKDLLVQMLIFFPIFAALFGASRLTGWTFITNGAQNSNIFEVLIGMAVQVFPLFASFKLLQMSNTVLGKVSSTLQGWSQPLRSAANNFSATQAATAKARYDSNNLSRNYTGLNRLNPARLRSFAAKREAEMNENRRLAEDRRQKILQEYVMAYQMNKDLVIDPETGRHILSEKTRQNGMSTAMRIAMENRETALNASGIEMKRDNSLGQPGTYAQQSGIRDRRLDNISARQAKNYEYLETQANAKRRNDLADKRYYAQRVLEASRKSDSSDDYRNLIVEGGGVDAINMHDLNARNSALTSVIANAYDITEAERMADINRATTFLNTQPTESVEAQIKSAMKNEDVNNLMAGLNVLDTRGDGDIAARYVREYMDQGSVKLGTEYANNLAKAMLQYSENQLLKGVGKMINVETLAYTQGRRTNDTITFKEFITGEADFDQLVEDADGSKHLEKYKPKYDIVNTTRGKDFTKANRTTMKAYMDAMAAYDTPEMADRILALDDQLRPQLVTAIPTYNSGSEEILAAAKYLTGMVQDGKGGWKFSGEVDLPDGSKRKYDREFFHERTRKYLAAFTPGDLIKFKSDILGATKQLFADVHLDDPDNTAGLDASAFQQLVDQASAEAKVEFQDIFGNKKVDASGRTVGNGAMSTLLAGDLSNLGAMKEGLRNLLDLDPDHINDTLQKYGIDKKV